MNLDLLEKGWMAFPYEPEVETWAAAAFEVARERVRHPDEAEWLRCGGTWFVGVDALPNDAQGRVGASAPLSGTALKTAEALYGTLPFHRGQVSVIYPGYPKPYDGESETAFGFRLRRDAAHVDGLLPVGETRRRHLMERHAYILGLPITACSADASPLTIWEGSHLIMRGVFEGALASTPQDQWDNTDLTEIYQAARRDVFDTCRRVTVPAQPGEAYLVHRLALHGVAPWEEGAKAPEDGRMIVYFRPEWPTPTDAWLTAP
ncbi:MAG: hypothetical protein AAF678_11100 [Pseudomonadota bacterium]